MGRLRGRAFVEHPEDYRAVLFREIRTIIDERIPTTVDARLTPIQRVQAALVRADRPELTLSFAHDLLAVTGAARLRAAAPRTGGLVLDVEIALGDPRAPVGVDVVDGEAVLRVDPAIAAVVTADTRRLGPSPNGGVRLVLRRRDDGAEVVGPHLVEALPSGGRALAARVSTSLDLTTISAGAPIWAGTWDLFARIDALGISRDVRLGAVRDDDVPEQFPEVRAVSRPSLGALTYWTDPGDNLSVRIAPWRPPLRRLLGRLRRQLQG